MTVAGATRAPPGARTYAVRAFADIADVDSTEWDAILDPDDLQATHRFVSVCQRSGVEGAAYRHVMVYRGERLAAIASFSRMDVKVDLLATGFARAGIRWVRRHRPSFLVVPVAFCGLPDFSTSTGNYADQLGLTRYLVGEGLVRRLVPRPVTPGDSVRLVEGRGFVNVPRTRALAFGVYKGGETAARPRPRGWVDVPSQNGLFGYVFVYDTLAGALGEREPALAARALELRDAILANTTYALPGTRRANGS